MLNSVQGYNQLMLMQQLQASQYPLSGFNLQAFSMAPAIFGKPGIFPNQQIQLPLKQQQMIFPNNGIGANQQMNPSKINNTAANHGPQIQKQEQAGQRGLMGQHNINSVMFNKLQQGVSSALIGGPAPVGPNFPANQNQIPLSAVTNHNPQSNNRDQDLQVIVEDMQIQERTSLYKLKFVFDDIRDEVYSLAWDRPLLYIPENGLGSPRNWNFSFRCRKHVFLSRIILDQESRNEFVITKVTVHDTESNADYPRSLPDEVHLNNKEWESQGQRLKCFVVEISYTPPANQEQKAEVCLQFELSNGTVVEKYVQVLKKPPNFKHDSYERESIETYKPLKLGVKKRNVVSSDNGMDDWTNKIAGMYKIQIPEKIPNVHWSTNESYKTDLHSALYLEELARSSCLEDLSLEANIEFSHSYKNGDNKTVKCDNKSVYAIFKCPFEVREDSVKGEALNDVVDYAILSRRGDWANSQNFVNCLGGKICDRFYRTEMEIYSEYDLRRDVRNFYIVVHIHKKDFSSQKYELERSEFMYIEFVLSRKQFVHCHYAVDQMDDVSAFFPEESELSYFQKPPWYVPPVQILDEGTREILLNRGSLVRWCTQPPYFSKKKPQKGHENCDRVECLGFCNEEHQPRQRYTFEMRDRYLLADLNYSQKEAVEACWYDVSDRQKSYPPILITGPFGTGKTHTLAYATQKIVEDYETARILICIVSRNTGNAYHRQLVNENLVNKCIRLFSEDDDLSDVDDDLLQNSNCAGEDPNFRFPDKQEILAKNVVIVTLSAAVLLHQLEFTSKDFTHVFIDEAAQVAEFFLVPVLSFVSRKNKLCITGDVMQLNPILYSVDLSDNFAHSIVQRFAMLLYTKPCGFRFNLEVNYRSNVKILDFAYPQFYQMLEYNDQSKEKGDAAFPGIYPLQFWNVRGKMSTHQSVASNCNWSEAYEVVKVVQRVLEEDSGDYLQEHGIGITTCYQGQVKVNHS